MITLHCSASALIVPGLSKPRKITTASAWFRNMAGLGAKPLAEERWWNENTVAVVTGANKGIGYEAALALAKQGLKTVVTARNADAGKDALERIKTATGSNNVLFHPLDITDQESVDEFAEWAGTLGCVTVMLNNAGMAYKGNTFGAVEARMTIDTNFLGTARVCEALIPVLCDGARIVNFCSRAGKLSILPSPELKARFVSAASRDDVLKLTNEFVESIEEGRHAEKGWPSTMYGMSKLAESTYTRVLAEQLRDKGVMVNACCPGYCATDMSSWRGTKSAAEGADTPVWLSLLPPSQFETGKFWAERTAEPF